MTVFDFISHESFPEDEYTKECVYIRLDKKYRVGYVRKKMQNGSMFWDVMSVWVKKNGKKEYLKAFTQDSNFLREDIQHFLDTRSWEKGKAQQQAEQPKSAGVNLQDDLPF